MRVEFIPVGNGKTTVKLDGRVIGEIRKVKGDPNGAACQYFPKGQKRGGEVFPTLSLCKYSLLVED